ncbi:MJ0042-type zinc finger domain-containing protein [Tautonia plasticadhaerens]|uniref:Zinc finger/thioredoxin putative domain-containing protein n=1 Tax=Tautonia plasticadhaerens TaxID=2527974 RepID=A0A518GXQ9_9BACT|nr:MJ0042-type zinc finger domain-containing protein [Tautonia plasticadhaerens]QDV33388.1 hypothetical protein ElP_12590 [Tautonia plasticadhaerens]
MKIRHTCSHCQASFLVTDEQLGQAVSCPKCGTSTRLPTSKDEVIRPASAAEPGPDPAGPTAFRPAFEPEDPEDEPRRRRRRRRLIPFAIGLIGGLAVASLVLLPMLRRPAPVEPVAPEPADPVEGTARAFLDALVAGDAEAIDRLSTLTDPPAISFHAASGRDPGRDETIRGDFAPIAGLHEQIAGKYTYDPEIGRFENANPLGVAADFMDEAEKVRQENEQAEIFDRIAGGTADEQLDAAVAYAESFANLTQNLLPRKELVPTYSQLVRDAEPPLPPDAEALALRYGEDKSTWDELLGRPFFTIEADGPFVLEEAEVTAVVRDRLASPGDPARRLRLGLVRFRLDAIDTGWKVVSARREDSQEEPTGPSPGESPEGGEFPSPGLGESP